MCFELQILCQNYFVFFKDLMHRKEDFVGYTLIMYILHCFFWSYMYSARNCLGLVPHFTSVMGSNVVYPTKSLGQRSCDLDNGACLDP